MAVKDAEAAKAWVTERTKDWGNHERNALIRELLVEAYLAGMNAVGPQNAASKDRADP